MIAILDAGPLYATLDRRDRNHVASTQVLRRPDLDFIVSPLVVAEVAYLAETRLGSRVEVHFLRGLLDGPLEIDAPTSEDWTRIIDLVEQYSDFPLGTTDASVVALAERHDTDVIVTLDRRHFAVVRSARGRPFRLLPE